MTPTPPRGAPEGISFSGMRAATSRGEAIASLYREINFIDDVVMKPVSVAAVTKASMSYRVSNIIILYVEDEAKLDSEKCRHDRCSCCRIRICRRKNYIHNLGDLRADSLPPKLTLID